MIHTPFEIIFLNLAMIAFLIVLEKSLFNQKLVKQKIKYDKLDLLKVGNQAMLRKDLEDKIGARVADVQVDSVNYMDGSASLVVKYNRNEPIPAQPIIFRNEGGRESESKDKLLVNGL